MLLPGRPCTPIIHWNVKPMSSSRPVITSCMSVGRTDICHSHVIKFSLSCPTRHTRRIIRGLRVTHVPCTSLRCPSHAFCVAHHMMTCGLCCASYDDMQFVLRCLQAGEIAARVASGGPVAALTSALPLVRFSATSSPSVAPCLFYSVGLHIDICFHF